MKIVSNPYQNVQRDRFDELVQRAASKLNKGVTKSIDTLMTTKPKLQPETRSSVGSLPKYNLPNKLKRDQKSVVGQMRTTTQSAFSTVVKSAISTKADESDI